VRADRSLPLPAARRAPGARPAVLPPGPGGPDETADTARTGPRAAGPSPGRLWGCWLLTRALLAAVVLTGQMVGTQQNVQGDLDIYAGWARGLAHGGGLPVGDDRWQYPPGAAVAFVLPELAHTLLAVPYRAAFVVLALLADAAVTIALARRDRAAALFWVVGITALGPVVLARFDLLPAAAALGALLAVMSGRAGRTGFGIGVGALLKVWPVLLLVALPRPGARVAARLAGGLVTAVAGLAAVVVAAGWWRDVLGFVGAQRARGLQAEAVAATPFVLAHMVGGPAPRYSYGSLQFDSPLARGVATGCSLVEVVVIVAAAVWWWLRASRGTLGVTGAAGSASGAGGPGAPPGLVAERSLALVIVVVVTARVLSPQYLVWLLALAAAALATGSRSPGWWRSRLSGALLAVALLSQIVYPWRYNDVIQGRVVLCLVLVLRNLGLLMVCWWAVRAAAAPRPGPPPRPRPPAPAS
jgi:hypothetical protein